MSVIRLSPSGPAITNEEGGMAEPGPGFQLRLSEAAGSTAMAALTTAYAAVTDIDGDPFEVELLSPTADHRYKANFHCDVDQITGAEVTVSLRLIAAYDGVTFDKVLAENTHTLPSNVERTVAIDVPITLGGELGATTPAPIPAATPSIKIRAFAKTSVNATAQIQNGGQSGTIWLSLAEML